MSDEGSLQGAFFGALQGTVSVLLTLLVGYVMARKAYLTEQTVKHVSKLCTTLFLPCLIVAQMGPELTAPNLRALWIVPAWGLLSTALAHALGWAGRRALRLPYWTVAAAGRPNSNALPLLLLRALAPTGVLGALARPGEGAGEVLGRATSLVLLNAVVQQTVTFQFAPGIMARDDGKRGADADGGGEGERLRPGPGRLTSVVQDPERVGLLRETHRDPEEGYGAAVNAIVDQPDVRWPRKLAPLERPVKKTVAWISAPFVGALIALVVGITPPLHKLFLSEGSALYGTVTQSLENLGELFVVLQMFTVGAELALVPHSHPGVRNTAWVLFVRFLTMPTIALLFVYLTAGRGLYIDDKLVWFILVLIPSGPSAMLLVSVAELVDVSQGPVAGYLTVSICFLAYLISPVMAVVTALGLKVVAKRVSNL